MANGNCAIVNGESSSVVTAISAMAGNSPLSDCESALKHNVGLSVTWTRDEQSLLENLLAKLASDSTVMRYAKIAVQLNDKTVRDVALRCRWTNKKKTGKQRKDNGNSSRKHKSEMEKTVNRATTRGNGDDGISYKEQLLEQNNRALDQVSANFSSLKLLENINLLSQTRNNIITLLNDSLNNMPETMLQMPPLPVKIHDELANSVLNQSSFPPMNSESF